MARTKVGQPVITANRLDVVHVALATEITGRRQVNLERLDIMWRAVVVRYCRAGHFQIFAAQKEQQPVARQTDKVRNEHELHGALRFELEALQDAATDEDTNAGTRYRDRTGKDTSLAFAQAELRFQILWQENHKAGNNHQFHAGPKTGADIHRIRYQAPHRLRNVCKIRETP